MSNFLPQAGNLLIVDVLNLSFRFKHERYKLSNLSMPEWATLDDVIELAREELEDSFFGKEFAETVQSIGRSYKARDILLVADLSGSSFRKALYPEYKGDREAKYANDPLDVKAASKIFMEHYSKLLDYLADSEWANMKLVVHKGIEADDIAAYIAENHSDKYEHTWLCTSDEDWDLLLNDRVSRFNWMTKNTWKNASKTGPRPKEVRLDNWSEHYLYEPSQHLAVKVLVGGEDNIQGVAGIGPKRAIDLVTKYGSIDSILAALPLNGTAQYIKSLNASAGYLVLAKKLMDLRGMNKEIIPQELAQRIDNLMQYVPNA